MSLGADASVSLQRRAGGLFLLLLAGAVAAVLALSGHSVGRGLHFEIEMATSGALKPGAKLRIAGRDIGEVLATRALEGPPGSTNVDERHVILDCFALREWTPHLHANSEYFIATPSILGEAYVEVGPPPHGDPAGPPIEDGARVRGVDPPQIDRLLQRVYGNLVTVMMILREQRPAIDELIAAGGALLADARDLLGAGGGDGEMLGRIRDAAVRTVEDARAIGDALDQADAVPRVRALVRDLGETARRVAPDLALLGRRTEEIVARLDALSTLLPPDRRARVQQSADAIAHAIDTARGIGHTVEEMAAMVDRCEGTLGRFQCDKELYDDLHEVHRILKAQPWTLIVKPGKGQKTIVR